VSFLLISARKDLKRRFADPVALLIWIGMPVMMGGMMSLLFGGDGQAPRAHVLVVNQDDSVIGNFLVGALGQGGMDEFLSVEEVDLETGRERIGDGDGTALLIVPEGFGTALLNDEPTELTLITNPAQRILPAIIVEGLEILGEAVFYGQRLLGEPIRELADGPPPGQDFFDSATIAELSAQINDRMTAAGDLLFPPVLDLDFGGAETAGEAGEEETAASPTGFDLARFFLPGMIFMSILFIAQGMSDDLWKEKQAGTLRRAVSSPNSLLLFVAGKLLAGLLLIAMVATMALLVGVFAFDMSLLRASVAVIWCAYAGTALLCLFLFIAILGSTQRAANLISMMTLFPLMMIGGSFFPFEMMPVWMRTVGAWTPNGLAVVQLRELLFGTPEPAALAVATLAIAATAGVTFLLCVRRLRGFVTA